MPISEWGIVAIIVGTAAVLCLFFVILSRMKVSGLDKKTKPMPAQVILGPRTSSSEKDSGIEKRRGMRGIGEVAIPLALKTVVGFYDKVYIGDTYSCKIYLFNTAKNEAQAEQVIKDMMGKDEQKKFENDTLYAKDQEPVKVKIELMGPNFVIEPKSRIIEIPAGSLMTSTHLIAPMNVDPPGTIIGKLQTLLISFDQIMSPELQTHLGSIDYQVTVEKAIIPTEVESEIKTQHRISYIASAAGAATTVLTVVSAVMAFLPI